MNHKVQSHEVRFFTLTEAAAYLALSPRTLYVWAEQKTIPAYKLGRVWRFDKEELLRFVRGEVSDGLYNSSAVGLSGKES